MDTAETNGRIYCLMQRTVIAAGLERSQGSHSPFACRASAPVDAQPAVASESQSAASRLGRVSLGNLTGSCI
jgi:hypothetical protein